MSENELIEQFERDLARVLDGLSPLHRALALAKAFSEVYGERWSIEAKADGSFVVKADQGETQ